MSPEEIEAWFLDHPGVLAYLAVLLAGSLVSLIVLLVRLAKPGRTLGYPVSTWPLSYLDFAIFFVITLLWSLTSGLAVMQVTSFLSGSDAPPDTDVIVAAGLFMQLGMLYIFLKFRFYHRNPNEGPISPNIISIGQSLLLGMFYFLASLPVVYGVSVVWNAIIELLRSRGMELDLPVQDAVMLIQETDNPLTFFGMIFLAVVIAPVVEEHVFRAGVYRFFKGKTSIGVALVISGAIFGVIHGNLLSLPGLVAVGVCLGLAYELSGSLRVAVFFHAFFNLNSIVLFLIMPEGLAG